VTRAVASNLYEALTAAISSISAAKTEARSRREARAAAVRALRKRVRGLINELSQLLRSICLPV